MVQTEALVIGCIKYGDSSLIAHLFTRELGYRSYLLKGILSSKKGKIKPSYFQPLTQLSVVVSDKNPDQLGYIRDLSMLHSPLHRPSDEIKTALQLFLCELLGSVLRGETDQNTILFEYLATTLQGLDAIPSLANFHIKFLLDMTKYLGFYPNTTHDEGDYFDIEAGVFCPLRPSGKHCYGAPVQLLRQFLGMNFDAALAIALTKNQRSEILDTILVYYSFHIEGFYSPKSLSVLHEVFEMY